MTIGTFPFLKEVAGCRISDRPKGMLKLCHFVCSAPLTNFCFQPSASSFAVCRACRTLKCVLHSLKRYNLIHMARSSQKETSWLYSPYGRAVTWSILPSTPHRSVLGEGGWVSFQLWTTTATARCWVSSKLSERLSCFQPSASSFAVCRACRTLKCVLHSLKRYNLIHMAGSSQKETSWLYSPYGRAVTWSILPSTCPSQVLDCSTSYQQVDQKAR